MNVSNFEELQAYANSGGLDTAVLHGSEGNDKFKAEPDEHYAKMYGGPMYNRVKFFDRVDAHGGGGKDLGRVFASSGNDAFTGMMGLSTLIGNGFEIGMHDFPRVMAFSYLGGIDTATMIDSALKDEFHGKPHKSELFDMVTDGDVYKITVRAFDIVHARATDQTAGTGGVDKAKLWGTAWDDRVDAWDDELTYRTQRPGKTEMDVLYNLLGFEWAAVRQTPGGTDTKNVTEPLLYELLFEEGWDD